MTECHVLIWPRVARMHHKRQRVSGYINFMHCREHADFLIEQLIIQRVCKFLSAHVPIKFSKPLVIHLVFCANATIHPQQLFERQGSSQHSHQCIGVLHALLQRQGRRKWRTPVILLFVLMKACPPMHRHTNPECLHDDNLCLNIQIHT
jgi:hypothetical protein